MMNIGEKLHGFEVTRIRRAEELDADLVEMVHEATGARLAWLDSGEENKTFSIAFKTIPENDTGVFHILEHTVLNGSEKYPVKEPFVELLKSSMQTFLNAMTASDKTIYPVSSRNKRDFMNLVSVYLDAVFHPLLLKNPNIFRQEGWHVEWTNRESEPSFKGVVYNEMKGAMAGSQRVEETALGKMIFPDSPYRFNSGGDPEFIPELTYEQYTDTYRRFYHPSNSYIWLDGNVPLDEVLTLLDETLTPFGKDTSEHLIPVQEVVPATETVCYTELAHGESPEGKTELLFGRIACSWEDKETIVGLQLLGKVLTGNNDAPLTRAILEAGLGQNVDMTIDPDGLQPVFMLQVSNTEDANVPAIRQLLKEQVAQLVKEGIDREELSACIDNMEFKNHSIPEPRGLQCNISALSSWMYGDDPLDYLEWDETLAVMRQRLDTPYFEDLLALMMDEKYLCLVRALPSATKGEEMKQAEDLRLQQMVAGMDDTTKDQLVAQTQSLQAWQEAPNSPEDLAKLPTLPLSEIADDPAPFPTEVREVERVQVILHHIRPKGIVHVNLYFATGEGDYQLMSLLPLLIGSLPTEKHSLRELNIARQRLMGAFKVDFSATSGLEEQETCKPAISVSISVLESKLEEAMALLVEMLTTTKYDDAKRIGDLLKQKNETNWQTLRMVGLGVAIARAGSHGGGGTAMQEITSGLTGMQTLQNVVNNLEEKLPTMMEQLQQLQQNVFAKARLTLSVTGNEPADVLPMLADLPRGEKVEERVTCKVDLPMREAIVTPGQVSYAYLQMDLRQKGMVPNGALSILSKIISLEWLWTEIRVKGGAYGAAMAAGMSGMVGAYTYRDPNGKNSLDVFRRCGEFLRNYVAAGVSLDNVIIATVGDSEPLLAPGDRARAADNDVLMGITYQQKCAWRQEAIATTPEKLLNWCDALDLWAKEGGYCLVGPEHIVAECGDDLVRTTIQ